MRSFYLIIPFLFLTGKTAAQVDVKKLSWLEGSWERVNTKPGKTATEVWTKQSESEWTGKGVNLKGTDTTFVEKLKIVFKDNNLYYVADIVENKEPVYFKFTEVSEMGFSCENPAHDFPKKIIYLRDGVNLKATISGNGKSIDFLFRKR
jgi:hypothetical protein